MIGKYVDDHLLISEAEIEAGVYYLFDTHRIIAEGAAALGVGAMLSGRIDVSGKRVAAVVTGGSVESASYLQIIQQGLERKPIP
jgi:threonine dehydratase